MKYYLDSGKKGYFQIDFTFAIAAFFLLFSVVFFMQEDLANAFTDVQRINQYQSDAYDLCHFLISQGGESDWEQNVSGADFIGIGNGTHINASILVAFNSTNYFLILDALNYSNFIHLNVKGLTSNQSYKTFGGPPGIDSLSGSSSCYAIYNDQIVELSVEVWR